MLNRTAKLTAAVAIALLALPAAAGSWPNIAPRKAPAKAQQVKVSPVRAPAGVAASTAPASEVTPSYTNDFEYVGGDTGWQPAGHKFVWSAGRFAHSEQCDHVIRVVSGPTPAEVESAKAISPGA